MSKTKRPYRPSAARIKRGLRARQSRREDTTLAGDRNVQRQMMTSELQHPRVFFRRLAENRDVVEVLSKHRTAVAAKRWPASSGPRRRSTCARWWPTIPRGGPPLPRGGRLPLFASSTWRTSSPSMICSTFTNPFWLSADDSSAIAAERCAAFICFRLMPPRGTKLVGKFDQRARCCASSKANRTLCRCFASSVARNLSAALTILEVAEVAVCPAAAVTEIPTATTTAHDPDHPHRKNAHRVLLAGDPRPCLTSLCYPADFGRLVLHAGPSSSVSLNRRELSAFAYQVELRFRSQIMRSCAKEGSSHIAERVGTPLIEVPNAVATPRRRLRRRTWRERYNPPDHAVSRRHEA